MSKPTVYYVGPAVMVGQRACLLVPKHPNHLPDHNVRPNAEVFTSKVLEHDEATGRIETLNTIYMPEPANEIAP